MASQATRFQHEQSSPKFFSNLYIIRGGGNGTNLMVNQFQDEEVVLSADEMLHI